MSIERIGGGFAVSPSAIDGGLGVSEVGVVGVEGKAAVSGTSGATRLERLQTGAIGPRQYVAVQVEEATAHLAGIPSGTLEAIRGLLLDRLGTDPALMDLVRQVVGGDIPEEK